MKLKINGLSKINLINLLVIILIHGAFVTMSLLTFRDLGSGENHPFAIIIVVAIFMIILVSSALIIIFSILLMWLRYRYSMHPNPSRTKLDSLNVAQMIFSFIGLIVSFLMFISIIRISYMTVVLTLYVLSMCLFMTLLFITFQNNNAVKNDIT